MLNRTGVIFCGASLLATAAVIAVLFQYTALSRADLDAARQPAAAENCPDIDLPGIGPVSLVDLMGYYIDNPPAPAGTAGETATPAVAHRFGGC